MMKIWHLVAFIGLQLLMPSTALIPFGFMPSQRAEHLPLRPRPNPYSSELHPKVFQKKTASADSSLHQYPRPASFMTTMHNNGSFVLSVVLWLSTAGISLERRTTVGKALSAPLATMALALGAANFGVLPFKSPICKFQYTIGFATKPGSCSNQ